MPTRPTTPEQKEDAARLSKLFDAWLLASAQKTGQKLTQEAVAASLNIGQSALSQRLRGRMSMSRDFAASVAKLIGCKVADFSPRLASEIDSLLEGQTSDHDDDFAQISRVNVSVSAGHGALVFEEPSKSALTFRRSFLQEIGVTPKSAVIVTVKGHSMDPTLRDGAVLLVNTAAKVVANGQIYAFRRDGQLYVKRMHQNQKSGYLAASDNPDRDQYPVMHIDQNEEDFEIIGRALWTGARL